MVAQSSAVRVVVVRVVPSVTKPPKDDVVRQISANSVSQLEGFSGVGTGRRGGILREGQGGRSWLDGEIEGNLVDG